MGTKEIMEIIITNSKRLVTKCLNLYRYIKYRIRAKDNINGTFDYIGSDEPSPKENKYLIN